MSRSYPWRPLALAVVAALLGFGAFYLRLQYALRVPLHVDEFTTLWAAEIVTRRGVPLMPSGVYYVRGVVGTYLAAAALSLTDGSITAGRLPNIIAGALTVVLTFWIGRREWNLRVGLIAGLGLMLLPEAIANSGRARFYGLLQLFTLLTLWLAYRISRDEYAPRSLYLLYLAAFALAVFTQAEAVLLFPGVLFGFLLWQGRAVLRKQRFLLLQLGSVLLIAMRFVIDELGQPRGFRSMQEAKPYLTGSVDLIGAWAVYGHYLVTPARMIWTGFALAGVIGVLMVLTTSRRGVRSLSSFNAATLYFAVQLGFMLFALFILVGNKWRDARYLVLLQPMGVLCGAAGMVMLLQGLTRNNVARWIGVAACMGWIWLATIPLTVGALDQSTDGYQAVFDYVKAEIRPGDVVMSAQPPACALSLGENCQYYARQRGEEPYVIARSVNTGPRPIPVDTVIGPRSQLQVDRWAGHLLLDDERQLQRLIEQDGRVWFVIDVERLAGRYETPFIQTVLEQFEPVYQADDTLALLADGWRPQPDYTVDDPAMEPVYMGQLDLMDWVSMQPVRGEPLDVVLYWSAAGVDNAAAQQVTTSLQLVAADGTRMAQHDSQPARGIIPVGEINRVSIPDRKRLMLDADLPDGLYRTEVVVYDTVTHDPVAPPYPLQWLRIGTRSAAYPYLGIARWRGGFTLIEASPITATLEPGGRIHAPVAWQVGWTPTADYIRFAHLIAPDGQIIAQSDQAPLGGFFPTSKWDPHDVVDDPISLDLPDELPPGRYELQVGWYEPVSGRRLGLLHGATEYRLYAWTVD